MDATDNNADNNVTQAGKSAGQLLCAARMERGLSVEDVARQLRLSVRQITAMEQGEYGKLPSGMFLRGFVRNYARLLHVEATPILQLLQQSLPPDPPQSILPQAEKIPFPSNQEQIRRNIIITSVLVALALPLLIYEIYRGSKETQPSAQQAQPAQPLVQTESQAEAGARQKALVPLQLPVTPAIPVETAGSSGGGDKPAPAVAAVQDVVPPASQSQNNNPPQDQQSKPAPRASASPDAGKDVLHFVFKKESWVAVRDGRGKIIFSQLNLGGSKQVVYGKPPFSLIVGNATAVTLNYNDQPVDLTPHTSVEVARLVLE